MAPRFALVLFAGFILAPSVHAQPPANPRTDSLGDPLPPGAIARLGTLRFKHNIVQAYRRMRPDTLETWISAAIYSPDGKRIASLDELFGYVRVWDAASGKELPGPWKSSDKYYDAIAWAPDGTTLATAGFTQRGPGRREIILWDIAGAKELKTFEALLLGQGQKVQALVFADGGKKLIAAGDRTLRWWDVASGKVELSWKPPLPNPPQSDDPKIKTETSYDYLFSPDAKFLAVWINSWEFDPGTGRLLNETINQAIGFDLATGKMNWRTTSKGLEMTFAFSADGKRVAIALGPNKVELRDSATGKLIDNPPLDANIHRTDRIGALALSPDGGTVAIAGRDGHVVLWNPADRPSPPTPLPDGERGDNSLRKFIARITQSNGGLSKAITFSPDGKTLLVGTDADLQVYDVATLKEVTPWDGHRGWVDYLAFSADGQRLLSGSAQSNFHPEELLTWDVATWKRWQMTSNRTSLSPNIGVPSPEHTFFVGWDGEDRLRLYDLSSGKQVGRFNVPVQQILPGAKGKKQPGPGLGFFSPGSKFYLLAGKDDQGKDIMRLYGVPSCKLLCQLPLLPESTSNESAWPVVFSSDDRLVALFSRDDGLIHVIETATGKLRQRLDKALASNQQLFGRSFSPGSLAMSQDGKLLASWTTLEPFVRVWDLETGRERLRLPPDGERHNRMHLAWSPDSRMLAAGDLKIQVWEVATGKVRREFTGHDGDVRSLAFSPDGRHLASGSTDTTVLIWDVWGR